MFYDISDKYLIMKSLYSHYFFLLIIIAFISKPSHSQKVSDSIKIVNKTAGYEYAYQDKKISFTAVGRILDNNETAYPHYITAYNFRATSNILVIAGGSIVVIGSIIAIARVNENNEQANTFTGVIIGLPLMALSIPTHYIAKHNMKKAIEIYNQDLSLSTYYKVKTELGLTSNGIGFIVHF